MIWGTILGNLHIKKAKKLAKIGMKSKISGENGYPDLKKSIVQYSLEMTIILVDFPIVSMVIFHSYVKLPEGIHSIKSH